MGSTTITTTLAAGAEADGAVVISLLVILAVAGLVAIVMQRMRLAVVPAYLIAGAAIGPNALGFVASQESLADVSHLAIVLLLFGIGLELDISILRRGLTRMIIAGLGSSVASVLVGVPVAMAFGLSPPAALAVSMGLALSSTAVVLRIISARRELRRRSGRLSFSILVIQDIVVLGMLALLPLLAQWSGTAKDGGAAGGWLDFAADACLMIGGVTALVVAAKAVLPAMLRESVRSRRLEVMMLVGIAAALAAAVVAQSIGFSLEMGAFLAGFVLSGTPLRHQLSGQIGPLRDIFSALFFTTVGMKVNPALVVEGWWIILVAVLLVAVLKSLVIGGTCWSVGALASTSIMVGLSLAQAGEFSLILLGEAGDLGILTVNETARCIAIVVVSLVITPGVADVGRRLGRLASGLGHAPWVRQSLFGKSPDEEPAPGDGRTHVIIGGFGPVGRRVAEVLDKAGASVTVIDLNLDTVIEQLREHRSIVFGDVANPRILESAGINHAAAIILTVPDEEAVLRACAVARRRAPDVFIAARTAIIARRTALSESGADHVTVDEIAAADDMVRVLADRLGLVEAETAELDSGEAPADQPAEPEPVPTDDAAERRAV